MAAKNRTPAEQRLELCRRIIKLIAPLGAEEQFRVLDAARSMIDYPKLDLGPSQTLMPTR